MSFLPHTKNRPMLRDSARASCPSSAPVAQLRKLRDANDGDGFDRALWQSCAAWASPACWCPRRTAASAWAMPTPAC